MRYYNRNQTKQDKVLDNSCYVISVLITFVPKVTLLYYYKKKKKFFLLFFKN